MLSERVANRLRDIIEDASRIETFLDGQTLSEFLADERTIFAVERLLQRITEAAIRIGSDEAAALGLKMPIAAMRAFGNRLRHEYDNLDRSVVYRIATVEIPSVRVEAEIALDSDGD